MPRLFLSHQQPQKIQKRTNHIVSTLKLYDALANKNTTTMWKSALFYTVLICTCDACLIWSVTFNSIVLYRFKVVGNI